MKYILLLVISSLFCACSLAPFGPTNSARSYGKGKMQAEVGNINSTYHLKYGFGLSDDLDLGFTMEFGEISTSALFFKYSFLNNETGLSLASEFGYGSLDETTFYYAGLISSLAFSKEFELFVGGRINSVKTNENDIEKDKYNGNIKILAYNINYLQLSYGFNIWLTENAGLSLYGMYFQGEDIETQKDSIFGGSFLFNF